MLTGYEALKVRGDLFCCLLYIIANSFGKNTHTHTHTHAHTSMFLCLKQEIKKYFLIQNYYIMVTYIQNGSANTIF